MASEGENPQKTVPEQRDTKRQTQPEKHVNVPKDAQKTGEAQELKNTLQRLQAEFENYQKRSAKQNEEYKSFANAKLIEELLPVLDSLEAGMQHNKEFALILEQFLGILRKAGLEKIHAEKGEAFDHDKMECLIKEKNSGLKEGAVTNILVAGYSLNGKILRAAKVSVNDLSAKDYLGKEGAKATAETRETDEEGEVKGN